MEGQHSSGISAAWKLAWTWAFVLFSNVDWLRFWQIGAAIGAVVFTVLQTWVLVRDKLLRRTRR